MYIKYGLGGIPSERPRRGDDDNTSFRSKNHPYNRTAAGVSVRLRLPITRVGDCPVLIRVDIYIYRSKGKGEEETDILIKRFVEARVDDDDDDVVFFLYYKFQVDRTRFSLRLPREKWGAT